MWLVLGLVLKVLTYVKELKHISITIQKCFLQISSHIHASQDSMSVVSVHVDNSSLKGGKSQSNLSAEKAYLQHMNVTVGILLNSVST